MRTAVLALTLGLLASACSSSAPSGAPLSGESLSKVADQIAEWHVEAGALLNEDAGFEVMTEEGFRCAANRLVDELGPSDVFDTFSEIAEPEIYTSVMVSYVDAIYVCGDLRRWTASEAVAEIGAALDVELDSEFFDCLVRGLSEEEVRDFSKQQLSNSDPEKIPDDSTIQWVDLGIHTRAEFCAPELAPVLEALLVDRVAQQSIDIDRAEGIDFTTKDEYRCAARRVVDELGINVVSDVLSSVAGAGDIAEFALILVTAQVDCVDQEKWADRMVEWFAATGLSAVERNGAEGLTPDDISCAARRFVDEVGPKVLNDVFNDVFVGAEDIVPFDEFDELGELADELSAALRSCVDLDRFSTPTTTTPTLSDPPEEDWEEIEEEIRSGLVEILIERGMTPEEAEIEADERMAEGTEVEVVEDQFAIWEDWMENYPSHPVLGNHWTADEAECVIIDMMKKRGIYETDRQIKGATAGGMDEEDAEFLVRPVADCVDLRAAVLADMVVYEYDEDPECLLAGVTEEQIASWYVADFTDGRDGFSELFWQDINQSC